MVQVIPAKPEDRFFLARVCRDANPLYNSIMPGAFGRQALKFETEGLPPSYEVQIVKLDSISIGFIAHTILNNKIDYLSALYILQKYQRRGFGTAVLNQFHLESANRMTSEVVLLAHKNAAWAIDFYKKNGFKIVTDKIEDIKAYTGEMEKYALPSTILMNKKLLED